MQADRPPCTGSRPRFSPRQSVSFHASRFDARKKAKRRGLYRRGPSVERGQTRRIERGIPCVRRLTASSVTEIHGSFALERAFEVPWLSPSDRRQPAEGTCDVRELEGQLMAANFLASCLGADPGQNDRRGVVNPLPFLQSPEEIQLRGHSPSRRRSRRP